MFFYKRRDFQRNRKMKDLFPNYRAIWFTYQQHQSSRPWTADIRPAISFSISDHSPQAAAEVASGYARQRRQRLPRPPRVSRGPPDSLRAPGAGVGYQLASHRRPPVERRQYCSCRHCIAIAGPIRAPRSLPGPAAVSARPVTIYNICRLRALREGTTKALGLASGSNSLPDSTRFYLIPIHK